jgi:hypothetical protein
MDISCVYFKYTAVLAEKLAYLPLTLFLSNVIFSGMILPNVLGGIEFSAFAI